MNRQIEEVIEQEEAIEIELKNNKPTQIKTLSINLSIDDIEIVEKLRSKYAKIYPEYDVYTGVGREGNAILFSEKYNEKKYVKKYNEMHPR